MICVVGPVIAVYNVENNVVNPHFLFCAIWEGKNAQQVWAAGGAGFPGGHFWLEKITYGDGFTQLGVVLGCASALPALLAAAVVFLLEKPRQYLWAIIAVWIAAIIVLAVSGIVKIK
jgi:hypothetical protein